MSRFIVSTSGPTGESVPLSYLLEEVQTDSGLSRCPITLIEQYKQKDAVGHEFIVASVLYGDNTARVRLERRPTSRPPAGMALQAITSYVRKTDDSISRIGADFDPSQYFHICTIRTRNSGFNLGEMCNLCTAITRLAPNYSLAQENCYWFCAAFICYVRSKPGVVFTEGEEYSRRGTFLKGQVVKDSAVLKQTRDYIALVLASTDSTDDSSQQADDPQSIRSLVAARLRQSSMQKNVALRHLEEDLGVTGVQDYSVDERRTTPMASQEYPGGQPSEASPRATGMHGFLVRIAGFFKRIVRGRGATPPRDTQDVEVALINGSDDIIEIQAEGFPRHREWILDPDSRRSISAGFGIDLPYVFYLKRGLQAVTVSRTFTKPERLDVDLCFD